MFGLGSRMMQSPLGADGLWTAGHPKPPFGTPFDHNFKPPPPPPPPVATAGSSLGAQRTPLLTSTQQNLMGTPFDHHFQPPARSSSPFKVAGRDKENNPNPPPAGAPPAQPAQPAQFDPYQEDTPEYGDMDPQARRLAYLEQLVKAISPPGHAAQVPPPTMQFDAGDGPTSSPPIVLAHNMPGTGQVPFDQYGARVTTSPGSPNPFAPRPLLTPPPPPPPARAQAQGGPSNRRTQYFNMTPRPRTRSPAKQQSQPHHRGNARSVLSDDLITCPNPDGCLNKVKNHWRVCRTCGFAVRKHLESQSGVSQQPAGRQPSPLQPTPYGYAGPHADATQRLHYAIAKTTWVDPHSPPGWFINLWNSFDSVEFKYLQTLSYVPGWLRILRRDEANQTHILPNHLKAKVQLDRQTNRYVVSHDSPPTVISSVNYTGTDVPRDSTIRSPSPFIRSSADMQPLSPPRLSGTFPTAHAAANESASPPADTSPTNPFAAGHAQHSTGFTSAGGHPFGAGPNGSDGAGNGGDGGAPQPPHSPAPGTPFNPYLAHTVSVSVGDVLIPTKLAPLYMSAMLFIVDDIVASDHFKVHDARTNHEYTIESKYLKPLDIAHATQVSATCEPKDFLLAFRSSISAFTEQESDLNNFLAQFNEVPDRIAAIEDLLDTQHQFAAMLLTLENIVETSREHNSAIVAKLQADRSNCCSSTKQASFVPLFRALQEADIHADHRNVIVSNLVEHYPHKSTSAMQQPSGLRPSAAPLPASPPVDLISPPGSQPDPLSPVTHSVASPPAPITSSIPPGDVTPHGARDRSRSREKADEPTFEPMQEGNRSLPERSLLDDTIAAVVAAKNDTNPDVSSLPLLHNSVPGTVIEGTDRPAAESDSSVLPPVSANVSVPGPTQIDPAPGTVASQSPQDCLQPMSIPRAKAQVGLRKFFGPAIVHRSTTGAPRPSVAMSVDDFRKRPSYHGPYYNHLGVKVFTDTDGIEKPYVDPDDNTKPDDDVSISSLDSNDIPPAKLQRTDSPTADVGPSLPEGILDQRDSRFEQLVAEDAAREETEGPTMPLRSAEAAPAKSPKSGQSASSGHSPSTRSQSLSPDVDRRPIGSKKARRPKAAPSRVKPKASLP